MAKKSDNALCMFCMEAPCACGTVKKPKAPKPKAIKKVETVAPIDDFFADTEIPKAKKVFKPKVQEHVLDLSLLSALSAVREIVTPQVRRQIDVEISNAFAYGPGVDERIHKFKTAFNGRRSI